MSTEFINDQWRLPNAWNGTESNVNKQSNYSMDFDAASSDYIDAGSSIGVIGTGVRTFSVWLKTSSNAIQTILGTRNVNTDGWVIQVEGTIYGTPNILFYNSKSPNARIQTLLNVADGIWHHIVIVRAGSGNNKIYVDGVSQTLSNGSENLTDPQSSKNLLIGAGYTTGGALFRFFDGNIDAVSIFDYALSSSQVTTLYGSSSTGIGNPMSLSPKPVAYYPLGDQDAFNGANYLVPNSSLKDYVFNFNNDYIDTGTGLGNSLGGSYSGDLTVSMWLKFDSISTQNGLFYIGDLAGGGGSFWVNSSISKLWLQANNGAAGYANCDISSLNTTDWYNLTFVYKGYDIANSKIYINNVSQTLTTSGNFNYTYDFTGKKTIIADYYNTPPLAPFYGEMSNVQIFNTALPATGSNSVETLYNNGSPLTSMSGFTSLVGWWKLDASAAYDSSTTTWSIPDDSTNSNTGTSSGMTQANLVQSDLSFKTSISPFALDFDGTNDYIDCGNDSSLSFSTSFSLSVWINNWSNDGNCVAMKGDGASYGYFLFAPHPSDLNKFKVWIKTSNNWYNATNDIGFSDNTKWVNLVVCYNSIDNSLVLYSNGVSGSVTTTAGTLLTGTQNFKFGVENNTTSFYNGSISNASIWNTELTSAQVTEIYNEGVPSNLNNHSAYSNLVSWWQLGSNSSFNTNWTVLDEKGSNNGSSFNMGEDAIVDGVGSYANGLSSGMGGDEVVGDAPYSSSNALSVNMDVLDRVEDTPA